RSSDSWMETSVVDIESRTVSLRRGWSNRNSEGGDLWGGRRSAVDVAAGATSWDLELAGVFLPPTEIPPTIVVAGNEQWIFDGFNGCGAPDVVNVPTDAEASSIDYYGGSRLSPEIQQRDGRAMSGMTNLWRESPFVARQCET